MRLLGLLFLLVILVPGSGLFAQQIECVNCHYCPQDPEDSLFDDEGVSNWQVWAEDHGGICSTADCGDLEECTPTEPNEEEDALEVALDDWLAAPDAAPNDVLNLVEEFPGRLFAKVDGDVLILRRGCGQPVAFVAVEGDSWTATKTALTQDPM